MAREADKARAQALAQNVANLLVEIGACEYEITRERFLTLRGIAHGNKASTVRVLKIAREAVALAEAETRVRFDLPTYSARETAEAKYAEAQRLNLPYQAAAWGACVRTIQAIA